MKIKPVLFALVVLAVALGYSTVAKSNTEPLHYTQYEDMLALIQEANKGWLAERSNHYSYICSYKVEHFGRLGEPRFSYEAKHPYSRAISMDPTLEWLIYRPVAPFRFLSGKKAITIYYETPSFGRFSYLPTSFSLSHWDIVEVKDDNVSRIFLVFVNPSNYKIENMLTLYPAANENHDPIVGKYEVEYLYDFVYGEVGTLQRVDFCTPRNDEAIEYDPNSSYAIDLDSIRKRVDLRVLATYAVSWVGEVAYFSSFTINMKKSGPTVRTRIIDYSLEKLEYREPGPGTIKNYEDYAYNQRIGF